MHFEPPCTSRHDPHDWYCIHRRRPGGALTGFPASSSSPVFQHLLPAGRHPAADVNQSLASTFLLSVRVRMRHGSCHPWSIRRRGFCVGLALLAYMLTALGIPLPAAPPTKDRRQPFPCQDRACGCQNAEECWRHCCCFSPEERLAWAEARGITPPAYAEKPATSGWHSVRQRDQAGGTDSPAGCCRCCQAKVYSARPSLTVESFLTPSNRCRPSSSTSPQTPRWVCGLSVLRCQGLTTLWSATGAVLPPPTPFAWQRECPFVGRVAVAMVHQTVCSFAPPIPPPR